MDSLSPPCDVPRCFFSNVQSSDARWFVPN
ncbi:BnaC03g64770D [Brassica napus]|uniref:BnaC03g64770D protein n=1 Tax=Brassica napus TaxID=3708 RepID=A0A078GQF8_BRANA|nr:BnaC03g64770D [Brassica napus]